MTVANARAAKPNARGASGGTPIARAGDAGTRALASAAPGELKGYAQRQIISEFGGAGEGSITVGAMLENDGLFSLTQMLGGVSERRRRGRRARRGGGAHELAGMFGGPISEALGAIASRPKPNGGAVNPVGGGERTGEGREGSAVPSSRDPRCQPAVARPKRRVLSAPSAAGRRRAGRRGCLAAEAAEGSRGAHAG